MGCTVATFAYNHNTWTATALGASFLHYEIQRTEDNGATWVEVARILTESRVSWDDYESLRDATTQYRLRVVRTDLAVSAWVYGPGVDPQPVGCEMAFTSNYDSTLNVAYNRPPEWEFDWPDADAAVVVPIYQRDRYVAFLPTEQRGSTFKMPLVINAVDDPGGEGAQVFNAIRAISVAAIPYVCVLDYHGNRFYAHLGVPDGRYTEPGKMYVANITVAEVAVDPTVVDVS